MKVLMIGLTAFALAFSARAEVFQMDRKGDTVVEVRKSGNEYKVTCKFKPQTKFDKAINAKINDAKGDSLCKKGLVRYLKVGTNETLTVSGLYSAAPVKTAGERLCYSFGVPVSGCKVVKTVAKPNPPAELKKPAAIAEDRPARAGESKAAPEVAETGLKRALAPERGAAVDSELPKEMPKEATNAAVRTTSFLCVAKYREINGERRTISRREYQGRNFSSPKEFERFCQAEFARIRAQGEANLLAVRKFGKRGSCGR